MPELEKDKIIESINAIALKTKNYDEAWKIFDLGKKYGRIEMKQEINRELEKMSKKYND